MCDISTKSDFKTKTIYKVCIKLNGRYFACFSRAEIKIGKIPRRTNEMIVARDMKEAEIESSMNLNMFSYIYGGWGNDNPIIENKTTGFATLNDAKKLLTKIETPLLCILKLKIGGEIYHGTGKGITDDNNLWKAITYAGSEILSFEEIM